MDLWEHLDQIWAFLEDPMAVKLPGGVVSLGATPGPSPIVFLLVGDAPREQ
jgi:hypothetical protein